jgi:nucleoside-diphosphate-sugar epimerase
MSILITGGCGYIGTLLTEALLHDGYDVRVVDTQWFGNYLPQHPRLEVINGDIRDIRNQWLDGIETIVHLANIANDPSVELDPALSWKVNVLAAQQLADCAVRSDVKKFIFASSGSVYGVKEEEKVTEELKLVPISTYNETKMVAERVLLSYCNDMVVYCVRPATVCGLSPRMRLDLSVNLLTMQALTQKRMTVFGGSQIRPNVYIKDLVDVYRYFLAGEPSAGCYNAGFENLSILEIANLINEVIPAEIVITESNDPRSYRLNSDKLLATGFSPRWKVMNAIEEIAEAYNSKTLQDEERWHNVSWMKSVLGNDAIDCPA